MKKLFVIALAALLVVMFSMPATAKVVNKFNGYWRTRFFSYDNLDYQDNGKSYTAVDTRTRLKYTAQLHDNLKLVNYFEMDATWGVKGSGAGDKDSYGQRGADRVAIEVKNTYADFNFANLQWVIGTQGFQDATGGFIYDDDYTGMKINYRSDNYVLSLRWIRNNEGIGSGASNNGEDFDTYDLIWNYKFGNNRIAPFLIYQYTNDGGGFPDAGNSTEEYKVFFLGFRYDLKFGNFKWWVNGIYESGDLNDTGTPAANENKEVKAMVFDTQLDGKWGQWGAFARFMYVSGDDDTTDSEFEGWLTPKGAEQSMSNYAELWGDGKFDKAKPDGTQGKDVTNIMAFGLGGSYTLSKAWMFKLAWWNLSFAQDGVNSQTADEGFISNTGQTDKNIGNEFDLWVTWSFMKAMKAHFLFSYLVAGDALDNYVSGATAGATTSAEDPWELGLQLELKF